MRVLGRCRDDHLLAATLDVQLGLRLLREHAGRLADVGRAARAPRDRCGVLLRKDLDVFAVHHEVLLAVRLLGRDRPRVPLMDAVVLQLVDHVGEVHERVVDPHHLDFRVGHGRPEDEAADAAEAVDPDLRRHGVRVGGKGSLQGSGGTARNG